MVDTKAKLEAIIGENRIKQSEPLEAHTISKRQASAEFYIEIDKTVDLIKAVQAARDLQLPIFIFGGGSYPIESKKNINGLVIKNNCRHFDTYSLKGMVRDQQVGIREVLVSAESGALMNQLVRYTIEEGLEGLEYQLGLPGTVGGALITNAKYKNKHARDYLHSLKILHTDGEVQTYTGDLPYFATFEDDFQETQEVILSAVFKLMPEDKKILWERGMEAAAF
jgi:UDP-N-acetylmuramate dehydrogenase